MKSENESKDIVKVNRGSYGEINLYEVSEEELTILENGESSDIYLNFALLLFPIGLSFITSLFLTEIKNIYVFVVFVLIAIVTIIVSAVLIVLWKKSQKGKLNIIKKIKGRMRVIPIDANSKSDEEVESDIISA